MNNNLLIVDDERKIINSLKRELKHGGYAIYSATQGEVGLNILKKHDIAVVLSDYMMPKMDGITFLEAAKQLKPDVVRLIITAYGSLDNAMIAINRARIFGYLTKPWSSDALRGTIANAFEHYNLIQENKRLQKIMDEQNQLLKRFNMNLENMVHERTAQLEEAFREGIMMLAVAVEARDDVTGEHVKRIYDLTRRICLKLGMSVEESERIGFFSMVHDIGKIHIPDNVLRKPGHLTDKEWSIMKEHTIMGEKILGRKSFYQTAREIARSHHERWDGSGYPDGLKGESIPLTARIVIIADIFDSLTHKRSYKEAWSKEDVFAEMKRQSGSIFDPEILEQFFEMQEVEPIRKARKM